MVPKDRLAELVGTPADQLVLLESRPLSFAFVDGRFEAHTIRVTDTGRIIQLTTSASGQPVDIDDIRNRSLDALERHRAHMGPELLSLLRRHPDLPRLELTVEWAGSGEPSEPGSARRQVPLTASAAEVQRLITGRSVQYVELVNDPEIEDEDEIADEDDDGDDGEGERLG